MYFSVLIETRKYFTYCRYLLGIDSADNIGEVDLDPENACLFMAFGTQVVQIFQENTFDVTLSILF